MSKKQQQRNEPKSKSKYVKQINTLTKTSSITTIQDGEFEGTIVINDEYASLIPSLSIEEFESLKQSIKEDDDGLTYAIIVNQHGVILDGYQRYKACQELGKDPKLQVKHFDDSFLEQKFRIEVIFFSI